MKTLKEQSQRENKKKRDTLTEICKYYLLWSRLGLRIGHWQYRKGIINMFVFLYVYIYVCVVSVCLWAGPAGLCLCDARHSVTMDDSWCDSSCSGLKYPWDGGKIGREMDGGREGTRVIQEWKREKVDVFVRGVSAKGLDFPRDALTERRRDR